MGVRVRLRSLYVLVVAVLAVALVAPPGWARPCANCEDPELPDPGGPNCSTISATQEPTITTASPQVNGTVQGSTGTWNSNAKTILVIWYVGSSPATSSQTFPNAAPRNVSYTPKAADLGKRVRLYVRGIGTDPACIKGEYSAETSPVAHGPAPQSNLPANIVGTPQVGQSLEAHPGTWTMSVDSFDMVWRWDSGEHRGTGPSYVLTAADVGKRIRLDVVVHRAGHQPGSSSFTTPGAVTTGPAPTASVAPTVSGERRVGATLTVTPGTWSPTPSSFTYQWLRGGTPIAGATQSTYALTPAALDRMVTVQVTAHRAGHASGTAVVSAGTIGAADALRLLTPPEIRGKAIFGEWISAGPGIWSPVQSDGGWQWLRDGQPIAGATDSSYRPVVADVGKALSVRVTASREGHADGVVTVEAGRVAAAPPPKWQGKKPGLKGKDKVKKKVRVALGPKKLRNRASAPGAKVSYQWLRNGKVIKKGAVKRAYKIKKADRSKKLRARITLSRPGYRPLVVTTQVVKIRNKGKVIR